MALFKNRKKVDEPVAAASPAESIDAVRRRARHRLIGAVVLVLASVVGFPLLFDTQPRPVSVDIPIEIPDRNKAKPLPLPSTPAPTAPAASSNGSGGSSSGTQVATAPSTGIITESADGTEIPSSRPAPSAPAAETRPEPKPETKPETKPE